jgi:hypothetical protein
MSSLHVNMYGTSYGQKATIQVFTIHNTTHTFEVEALLGGAQRVPFAADIRARRRVGVAAGRAGGTARAGANPPPPAEDKAAREARNAPARIACRIRRAQPWDGTEHGWAGNSIILMFVCCWRSVTWC